MIERLIAMVPAQWREIAGLLLAPIMWVPRMQSALVDFFLESASPWSAAAKYIFLLLPMILGTIAIWSTQLAIYTVPFRTGRSRFVSAVLLAWWDAAFAVWLYWVGLARAAMVTVGWLLALSNLAVHLGAALVRHIGGAPFAMTRGYVTPGFHWVAFAVLLLWCVLEAAVFTYTLMPTVADVLADIIGSDDVSRLAAPILYLLLLMLIAGSFACVHALMEAVRQGHLRFLAQIVLVQVCVLAVEVLFFYRPLVDTMTPWVAQGTGLRLGVAPTLLLATMAWIGVRGMTWFLFGQYGAPSLLALIAHAPLAPTAAAEPPRGPAWWRPAVDDLRVELGWLHRRSDELLEHFALPVLNLLGAAVNFATILTAARPAFGLPFKGLKEATEQRALLASLHLQPRKQTNP
jgi:hypothetical protein